MQRQRELSILTQKARVYSSQEYNDCMNQFVNGIKSTCVTTDEIRAAEPLLSPRWSILNDIRGLTKFFSYSKHYENTLSASVTTNSPKNHLQIIDPQKPRTPRRSNRKI